jgi:glycosyltransferase involved in cell wall biosynthesis
MGDGVRRPRIAYVTDLPQTVAGGGAYAVNFHAFRELEKRFDAHYTGPIVPRIPPADSAISKFRRRILRLPGSYSYFSPATLDRNASEVTARLPRDAEAIVFRSAGRWCRCRPGVPYFVYLDAVVHTFFHNTFRVRDFHEHDLDRIWREERSFLEAASGVFFESEWGRRMAAEAYALEKDHYGSVGRGGVIDPPRADTWDGASRRLVTMAMDFQQKGGDLVAEAFRRLKPRYPSLAWDIVGGAPGTGLESTDSVTYHGILDPGDPTGRAKLERILAGAFLCVHPTREDTSPLVITEAAYFGCPTVSVRAFAIPELVLDGETGLLIDTPASVDELAVAIETMLANSSRYVAFRRRAREHSLAAFRWEATGTLMCDFIERAMAARS